MNNPSPITHHSSLNAARLAARIKAWGVELGFQQVGIADCDLSAAEPHVLEWFGKGYHGEMKYLERQGVSRARPAEAIPGTVSIIAARMNFQPPQARPADEALGDVESAYIARYTLGRDYHKIMRERLEQLAGRIGEEIGEFKYKVFSDNAPVMEVETAEKAGLGWRGKHLLLLNREAGSSFVLGEIYTDLLLPADSRPERQCGKCQSCIDQCPTGAIVGPYQLDARRCIAYLTAELKGSIPVELRPLIGNRVYGCDDCQLACPWTRFAQQSPEEAFRVRHGLDAASLVELFSWSEQQFEERMKESAIYRIGYKRWLRNLAVGLGNAPKSEAVVAALRARSGHPSPLVREHVEWALQRQDAA
jgi:epoxyqueuosine reductase